MVLVFSQIRKKYKFLKMKSPQGKVSITPKSENGPKIILSNSCDFSKMGGFPYLSSTSLVFQGRKPENAVYPSCENTMPRTPKENLDGRRPSNACSMFATALTKEKTMKNSTLEQLLSPQMNAPLKLPQLSSSVHDSLGNKSRSIRGDLRAKAIRKRMMDFENSQLLYGNLELAQVKI
jgi:hypothetical protein